MNKQIVISEKQLESLRRFSLEVDKLNELLQGLGVREQEQTIAPRLSKEQERINYYLEKLSAPKKRKKLKQ